MKALNGPFPGRLQLYLKQYDHRTNDTERLLRYLAALPGINYQQGAAIERRALAASLGGKETTNTIYLKIDTLVRRGMLTKVLKGPSSLYSGHDDHEHYRASGDFLTFIENNT